jgi:hypothetical protein
VARVTVIAGPTRSPAISKRKPPQERGGVPQAHAVREQNIYAVKETALSCLDVYGHLIIAVGA